MIEIRPSHTHLYNGARGRVLHQGAIGDRAPVLIAFADGITTTGRLTGPILIVPSYQTKAGTVIAAKAWHLVFSHDHTRFLVERRAALDAQGEN